MDSYSIDDLQFKCPNSKSREFISEAINSYKANAYRAAITYTWIAVFFDIYQKIEQLSLLGDAEAFQLKSELDLIRAKNDIPGMLTFERELLRKAREKFELFDEIVYIDLKRIQEDRNRCAHPLMHSDDNPYSPSAEQARNHMLIAVNKLLSEKNVYGKSVMDNIYAYTELDFFPIDCEKAFQVLDGSYLAQAKDSLVRNLLIKLLKDLLKNEYKDYRAKCRRENIIKYIIKKYRMVTESVVESKLHEICDYNKEVEISRLIFLFCIDNLFWIGTPEDKRILIIEFLKHCPSEYLSYFESWGMIQPIQEGLIFRMKKATRDDLLSCYSSFFCIPEILCDRILELYLDSPNFEKANQFAHVVSASISELGKERVLRLINGISKNSQISYSWELKTVINTIKKSNLLVVEELNELLIESGLEEYYEAPL